MTTKPKPADRVAELRALIREYEAAIRGAEAELRQIEAAAFVPPVDYATPAELKAYRDRRALVERLYTERRSITEAEEIADLILNEGLDEAEAIRRYDAGEEENEDDN